ncbi:hypothetical protein Tco_1235836 [Tanacetum coccineum]
MGNSGIKGFGLELTAFSTLIMRKIYTCNSTSGGYQFSGDKIRIKLDVKETKLPPHVFSQKRRSPLALSASCAQVMWMRTHLKDYRLQHQQNTVVCDSQSAIANLCNTLQISRTKAHPSRNLFIQFAVHVYEIPSLRNSISILSVRDWYEKFDSSGNGGLANDKKRFYGLILYPTTSYLHMIMNHKVLSRIEELNVYGGIMSTKIDLTRTITTMGVSMTVLVSNKAVVKNKRNVWIKWCKQRSLSKQLKAEETGVNTLSVRIQHLIADIENDIMDPVMQCTTFPDHLWCRLKPKTVSK